ncbi:cation:proton antiporter [Sinorhizobium glycinis]|uniref:Cation:proton antiporter n=1 Tax=Sinorhizobium glycinis TaxID=1472378 RepID=A0A178XSD4_9HYPH|nr:Na+/H+ antiporter subunit E [Sinorhizobium glycinis]OAP37723.1 cation:proton antiporter [Sinorhizobium glycinis]
MRAWYPYPLFSIALFLMWLLLNQSVAPGSIVLSLFLSTLLGWVMVKLQPSQSRLRRLGLMAGFALAVAADIIRSNVAVARIILRPRGKPANTGFMTVDVDLENENALALLACILTATPGTAWLEYDRRQKSLLLHVLDIDNEDLWRRTVKRYEAGLKEILE